MGSDTGGVEPTSYNSGMDNGRSQLSEREVLEIYTSQKTSLRELRKNYNCSHVTIWNIRTKRTWKKVTDRYDEVQKALNEMTQINASDYEPQ